MPNFSPNPRQKRAFWTTMAVLTTLLVIGMVALFTVSCTSKKPHSGDKTVILADTTRVRLQHVATASADSVTILQPLAKPTQDAYENADHRYDSLRIRLSF